MSGHAVREATRRAFERCERLAVDSGEASSEVDGDMALSRAVALARVGIEEWDSLPIDKLSRWLGYVQAVLVANGLTTVDRERDATRPLFREAYVLDGLRAPDTFDVSSGDESDA